MRTKITAAHLRTLNAFWRASASPAPLALRDAYHAAPAGHQLALEGAGLWYSGSATTGNISNEGVSALEEAGLWSNPRAVQNKSRTDDPRKRAINKWKSDLRRMEHRNVEYRYFEGDSHRVGSIIKLSVNGNFEVRGPQGQLLTVTTSKARALDALASHIALSHPSSE